MESPKPHIEIQYIRACLNTQFKTCCCHITNKICNYTYTYIFKPEQKKSTWTLFVVKFDKFKPMAVTHHQAAASSDLFLRACALMHVWVCARLKMPWRCCNDGWAGLTMCGVLFFSLFILSDNFSSKFCMPYLAITFAFVMYKGVLR